MPCGNFQPIHPLVYLGAADPAEPVCLVKRFQNPYLQLQEPCGALFLLKAKSGRTADACIYQFLYAGILEFQEGFKKGAACSQIRGVTPCRMHEQEGAVQVPLDNIPGHGFPSG